MIVPTGSAFLATSTFGPTGTVGAAAACWAPAPANMFLAITAVTTAITRAPTSRATFFTSMARSPPQEGLVEQPHTSDKLVKKPLGENRDAARGDRDSVRNFGPSFALAGAVQCDDDERQHASGERGQDEETQGGERREPKRQRGRQLDVPTAHHARVECGSEQNEDSGCGSNLHRNSRPRRQRDRGPINGREQRNREVQPVRNGECADVHDCRENE